MAALDVAALAADAALATFGRPVTIAGPGGAPVVTTAIVTPRAVEAVSTDGLVVTEWRTEVAVRRATAPPLPHGTVLRDGAQTYTVDGPAQLDAGLVRVWVREA